MRISTTLLLLAVAVEAPETAAVAELAPLIPAMDVAAGTERRTRGGNRLPEAASECHVTAEAVMPPVAEVATTGAAVEPGRLIKEADRPVTIIAEARAMARTRQACPVVMAAMRTLAVDTTEIKPPAVVVVAPAATARAA